jgi:hypothetical protein
MEAAGLLRREPHPGDRRLGPAAAHRARALATFEPAERESVIRALTAIRRNLTGA